LKWGGVDEIIIRVRLQTWFTQRQKYWVVMGDEKAKDSAAEAGGQGGQNMPSKGGSENTEAGRDPSDNGMSEGTREDVTRCRKRKETGEAEGNTVKRVRREQAGDCEDVVRSERGVAGRKRVRFAGQVEVGGLDGLKQQLDRWSRQCVVCFLTGGRAAEQQMPHTVWECQQEVAEGIRMDSRYMEDGLRAVQADGGCAECGVPRVLCERWQWGGRREESTGRCQYAGVMVSTMIAVAALGRVEGRGRVGAWLRRDGLDPRGDEREVFRWFGKKVPWEGVEAGQAVTVFMMLARMNGGLRGMGDEKCEGRLD
jgi:hypothetical protein